MKFPIFRVHSNRKHYYKIHSDRSFTEVQLIGKKAFIHEINAQTYFEILRIQEMIELNHGYQESAEKDFEKILNEKT